MSWNNYLLLGDRWCRHGDHCSSRAEEELLVCPVLGGHSRYIGGKHCSNNYPADDATEERRIPRGGRLFGAGLDNEHRYWMPLYTFLEYTFKLDTSIFTSSEAVSTWLSAPTMSPLNDELERNNSGFTPPPWWNIRRFSWIPLARGLRLWWAAHGCFSKQLPGWSLEGAKIWKQHKAWWWLVEWQMDRIGFIFVRLMISPARGRLN